MRTIAGGIILLFLAPIISGCFAGNVVETSVATHKWKARFLKNDIQGNPTGVYSTWQGPRTYNWKFWAYYGFMDDGTATLTSAADILGLQDLQQTFASNWNASGLNTLSFATTTGSSAYCYIAVPFASPIPSYKLGPTFVNIIPMTDGSALAVTAQSGFTASVPISMTNQYGVSTDYYVYRTQQAIGGTAAQTIKQ